MKASNVRKVSVSITVFIIKLISLTLKIFYIASTFWKDSPSSIYWDVWSLKLVSIDENGLQSGTVFGYGCKCEEMTTRLGILYDARNRTVSFFKNGINQGVAFTNIASGMRPSLDVWFQTGEIEILPARYPS